MRPGTAATSTCSSIGPPRCPATGSARATASQVSPHGVVARAATAHGLFNAAQTIRQLLPAAIANRTNHHGPWTMRATSIVDYPRYEYRGFMLDIARHYQTPAADRSG